MNCPECGVYLSFHNRRCDKCNADLTSYRRLWSISNQYYNDGLNKAKVRDLSGAIQALKISLQMDKTNTNARNLLGLVYYEMGETVNALSEWVLSKNYQEHDNMADYYMNKMRDFYRLAGGIPSFSSEMLEIKSKPTLSKKELYKRILEIQAEWKNDKYAQEHLSDGIKIFFNDTIA